MTVVYKDAADLLFVFLKNNYRKNTISDKK